MKDESPENESDSNSKTEPEDFDFSNSSNRSYSPQRRSFVWDYFKPVPGSPKLWQCVLCNVKFASKTTNLGRHLLTAHKIEGNPKGEGARRGRTSSFIWKFCSRANDKQALCHLCKKLLYFGGGNTSNITKHLRRKHASLIALEDQQSDRARASPAVTPKESCKKERNRASYVWNYCQKVSSTMVHCNICLTDMNYHGTANLIKHLSKHNIVGDKSQPKSPPKQRSPSPSLVWRYFELLNYENVSCRICSEHLDYDGTTDILLDHLERLHNIIINEPGRKSSLILDSRQTNSDTQLLKCQMCDEQFELNEGFEDAIVTHMETKHNVKSQLLNEVQVEEIQDLEEEVDLQLRPKEESVTEELEMENSPDEQTLYNDIIEEDWQENVSENPLSPLSGEQMGSDTEDNNALMTNIEPADTAQMRQLKEELVRQQTIYFNEKAGFYRMQKHLVALQVKRERLEIAMMYKQRADEL